MKDKDQTKEQRAREQVEVKRRIAELEKAETERTQMKEALRKSEAKYRAILENIEDGYLEIDFAGNVTFSNPSACRIIGYSADELKGMSYRKLVGEKGAGRMLQVFGDIYRTSNAVNLVEHEFIRKDGTKACAEFSISLIKDEKGNPLAFCGIGRDITDRKHAEVERERLILELRDALSKIRTLSGLLPICSSCKKIRNDKGYWEQLEVYISNRSEADFSHGICPDCAKRLYPAFHK